jgi:hypothetical protein
MGETVPSVENVPRAVTPRRAGPSLVGSLSTWEAPDVR